MIEQEGREREEMSLLELISLLNLLLILFIHYRRPLLNNVGKLLVVRNKGGGKQEARRRREIDMREYGDFEREKQKWGDGG